MIKLISWNVNGIRAAINKGLWGKIAELNPDTLSLQETKATEDIMVTAAVSHSEYNLVFHSATNRKGYSGVATFSRVSSASNQLISSESDGQLFDADVSESLSQINSTQSQLEIISTQIGLGLPEFDEEGRCVVTSYRVTDPASDLKEFTLINCYYPQGGRGPHRIEYKIRFYAEVKKLADSYRLQQKHVILCGDFNTTITDIDLARPAQNRKTTGCLPEEREAFNWFLNDGFIDTFRHFYPTTPDRYSYWDQITKARERNVGWRIDYFLVSQSLLPFLKSAEIHDQVFGSDHAPVSIELATKLN